MRCNNCGKKLSNNVSVCPVCGNTIQNQINCVQSHATASLTASQPYVSEQSRSQLGQHFCPTCGSVLSPHATFCANCGNKTEILQKSNPAISALSKYKKYIAIAIVLIVVVIFVIALVSRNNVENTIVGTWMTVGRYENGEFVEFDQKHRREWEFKSNYKLLINGELGKYTIDDDILTVSSKDYDDEDSYRIIKLTKKTLVLETIEGSTTQIVFEKQ